MELNVIQTASEILETANNIFVIVEQTSPEIFIELACDAPTQSFDFEDSTFINGRIVKEGKAKKCYIVAGIRYINREGKQWGFAKVKIFEDWNSKIQIQGKRTGSYSEEDYYNEDFLRNPDPELDLVLESMRNGILTMLEEMQKEPVETVRKLEPKWLKSNTRT